MKLDPLIELVSILRKKCPWDRTQTLKSLKNNLIEEAYEFVEAVEANDIAAIKEELGDILFLVTFLVQILKEKQRMDFDELIKLTIKKYKEKHPHVFKGEKLKDQDAVVEFWHRSKSDIFEGIPKTLPALQAARTIQERAARLGFDWQSSAGPLRKIGEEIGELNRSKTETERFEELGDLLFACVNLARHLRIDPEDALRSANKKFVERFRNVVSELEGMGRDIRKVSLEEMDRVWEEQKGQQRSKGIEAELRILKLGLNKLKISYDTKILKKFRRYLELLYEYRGRVHLISKLDYTRIAHKHFLVSLLPYQFIKGHKYVCDVGAGAGFPSIPLKIFFPDMKFVLFESRKKKAEFLVRLIKELGLKDVEVRAERAEEYKKQEFDLALFRAAGRIDKLVKVITQLVKPGGEVIFYKGLGQRKELGYAQKRLRRLGFQTGSEVLSNPIDKSSVFLVILKRQG
ncbi:hypothetical protein BXT86_02925 [candidate division WOR-3 bacterium 4484_100]|uniref:Ribosomal RNA small subunit methyltransferase G n=1 Tax=candidate division WOR-3 bacterium 4484_100 TaxID=1936077 RepID=A0A1V4QFF9_UNCW3|nr:MAG: hypothetical protein BXT86_02925 [candidate division WOR-3 bacterium 4484_100]